MAEVCKGNVYLTIDEEDIEKYMAKGFSLVDEKTGRILKQSIPTEIGPLKKLYSEQVELNKKLTEEIAVLRNKIESLQQVEVEKSAPASEDSATWDDWSTEETPKKTNRRTKK